MYFKETSIRSLLYLDSTTIVINYYYFFFFQANRNEAFGVDQNLAFQDAQALMRAGNYKIILKFIISIYNVLESIYEVFY